LSNCIFIPFNLEKSDDLANIFYNILKYSPLKEIRFNEHIPDFYDARSDAFYPINLAPSTAASFVNALLNNVFIEKCDIMLPRTDQKNRTIPAITGVVRFFAGDKKKLT
jgi:hypothetical protein